MQCLCWMCECMRRSALVVEQVLSKPEWRPPQEEEEEMHRKKKWSSVDVLAKCVLARVELDITRWKQLIIKLSFRIQSFFGSPLQVHVCVPRFCVPVDSLLIVCFWSLAVNSLVFFCKKTGHLLCVDITIWPCPVLLMVNIRFSSSFDCPSEWSKCCCLSSNASAVRQSFGQNFGSHLNKIGFKILSFQMNFWRKSTSGGLSDCLSICRSVHKWTQKAGESS